MKFWLFLLIMAGVIITYIIMTAAMPVFVDMASTVNATSVNWTNYPGSRETINASPLWMYFIPGIVGIIMIVMVLKRGDYWRARH